MPADNTNQSLLKWRWMVADLRRHQVALRLRKLYPQGTIAVITMYKGQLNELLRLMPAAAGVEVLTVDSCQGSPNPGLDSHIVLQHLC